MSKCNREHDIVEPCQACFAYDAYVRELDDQYKDTHDLFELDHVARFLRNHMTGIDNLGRRALADIVAGYENPIVIDCASGTAVNWEVFKAFGTECQYIAFDRTKQFLEHAKKLYGDEIRYVRGYLPLLPFKDNYADICILRHIGEHLHPDTFKSAIKEAFRVASKEVIIVLFEDLSDNDEDVISLRGPDERGCTYYWNTYSAKRMKEFLDQFDCKLEAYYVVTPGAAAKDTIIRIIK